MENKVKLFRENPSIGARVIAYKIAHVTSNICLLREIFLTFIFRAHCGIQNIEYLLFIFKYNFAYFKAIKISQLSTFCPRNNHLVYIFFTQYCITKLRKIILPGSRLA